MPKIYIDLINCYGIPKFMYTFQFDSDRSRAHLIYAPNGVMKTSFANTLSDICTDKESKDCFYPERETKRIVKFEDCNGIDLTKKDILVIEPYAENYKPENLSILLANEELKEEYERIHREINEKTTRVFSALNNLSGKRSSEVILSQDFDYQPKYIFECLEKIYSEYNCVEIIDFSQIKYGKLFTTDSEKILSDSVVIIRLQSYIEQYEKLLSESSVFKVAFNHNSAEDVLITLAKEGFFKADHKVLLANTEVSVGECDFKKIIDDEKSRILDVELADEFKNIDTLLSSKAGTKALRDFIFENKEIIPELIDLKEFKKKIWISYLFKDASIFQEAILNYQNNKRRLAEIIEIAKSQTSKWNEVVSQFNERFSNMPFKLDISNRDDVVLKSKLPSVSFIYKDRGEETSVEEKELILHLSNGEKKALYLLNILFEIHARKEMNIPTFLIMDDVADSFDYRNKYAIIEYIKDIVDSELFMPVILTHNFDFYRTVAGRVEIKPTSNFVMKSETEVQLVHGQYFENVFDTWRTQVYTNNAVFLSSIAFVRNLIEYTNGRGSDTYNNLTSLLHFKKNVIDGIMATDSITNHEIATWYSLEWGRVYSEFKQIMNQPTINLIYQVADDILSSATDSIDIENKIILSIAIRQKAERYMVNRIGDDSKINSIRGNQTRRLRDLIQFDKTNSQDVKIQDIIERVLIVTSENIHINSFMYEPIVDMSLSELKKLYTNINAELMIQE